MPWISWISTLSIARHFFHVPQYPVTSTKKSKLFQFVESSCRKIDAKKGPPKHYVSLYKPLTKVIYIYHWIHLVMSQLRRKTGAPNCTTKNASDFAVNLAVIHFHTSIDIWGLDFRGMGLRTPRFFGWILLKNPTLHPQLVVGLSPAWSTSTWMCGLQQSQIPSRFQITTSHKKMQNISRKLSMTLSGITPQIP